MLVIQSYRETGGEPWVYSCMETVQRWAHDHGHDYCLYGDREVLEILPPGFYEKVGDRWAILTDYARLAFCEQGLEQYEDVLWIDADVLLHRPGRFSGAVVSDFAFGREVWVDGEVHRGIHNAICYFRRGNPFLSFYRYACARLVARFEGEKMSPQFIGPKLLKHYDSLLQLPTTSQICMMSPQVTAAIIAGDREIRALQSDLASAAGVNLCSSLISPDQAVAVIDRLLA